MIEQKKRISRPGFYMLIVFLITGTTVLDAASEQGYEVQVDERRLSIRATRTPLTTLLAKVSQESGIEIFYQGVPEGTVTIHMDQVALETGMKRLVRGHNHAFTYGYNKLNDVVVTQLYIYSKKGRGDMTRIMPEAVAADHVFAGESNTGIALYPETPSDKDPLLTMQAIDPLMKINEARAPYLPEDFHGKRNDGRKQH